jgi:hypothetical protein
MKEDSSDEKKLMNENRAYRARQKEGWKEGKKEGKKEANEEGRKE